MSARGVNIFSELDNEFVIRKGPVSCLSNLSKKSEKLRHRQVILEVNRFVAAIKNSSNPLRVQHPDFLSLSEFSAALKTLDCIKSQDCRVQSTMVKTIFTKMT